MGTCFFTMISIQFERFVRIQKMSFEKRVILDLIECVENPRKHKVSVNNILTHFNYHQKCNPENFW